MCRVIQAGGCGPVIDIIECADPNCPMRYENTIPMNDAAVEQRAKHGLPPHPAGKQPNESDDAVIARLVKGLFP